MCNLYIKHFEMYLIGFLISVVGLPSSVQRGSLQKHHLEDFTEKYPSQKLVLNTITAFTELIPNIRVKN